MTDPFSQDILAEILKRLPLKSVFRVRCVQKSWYHLIRSPYFIDLRYNYHKNMKNKYFLFQDRYHDCFSVRLVNKRCDEYCPQPRYPLLKDMRSNKKIYGTSRGLICFATNIYRWVVQVYIWNPFINKYRTLPSNHPPCYRVDGLAFGYFGEINDYNVIKLEIYSGQSEETDYAYVYIYSLSTNSWKTVGKYDFARFRSYLLYNSVVVNGAAYWVLRKWYFENDDDKYCCQVIVRFDTVKETIQEIMLPPQVSTSDRINMHYVNLLGEFGEVSLLYVDLEEEICQLWRLENEGEANKVWTKMSTVNLNEVGEDRFPIGFSNNLELVLIIYDFDKPGFCSYDPELKEVTEMVDDASDLWSYAYFQDIDRYDNGDCGPFDHQSQEDLQPMYVNSFEESLVLLGEEDEVEFKDD